MRLQKFGICTVLMMALTTGAIAQQASNPDLVFTGPTSLTGAQGSEVFFNGTLTNNSATNAISLDAIGFSFSNGSFFTGDDAIFFSDSFPTAGNPGVLAPGQTYTGSIFGIQIAANAPVGTYTDNNASITNTEAGVTFVNQLAVPFEINVTVAPVPEPGTLLFFGFGVAGILGLIHFRRRGRRRAEATPA